MAHRRPSPAGRARAVVARVAALAMTSTLLVAGQQAPAGAIIGGQVATTNGTVVALLNSPTAREAFCSGALIAPRIVITAGHCVVEDGSQRSFPNDLYVSAPGADTARDALSTRSRALRWWWVSSYVNSSNRVQADDIAVIVLERALSTTTQPRLATTSEVASLQTARAQVTHLGYGKLGLTTRNDGAPRSASLQLQPAVRSLTFAAGSFFQSKGTATLNICPGDSGGAVTATVAGETVIVGIQSGGDTACVDGYTGADTAIGFIASYYLPLIRRAQEFIGQEPPSAPRALRATTALRQVTLEWDAPQTGADRVTGYLVERWTITRRSFLGVQLQDDRSTVIAAVVEGSPAEQAGLRAGDRIVAVNAVTVTTPEEVRAEIQRQAAGARIQVTVDRSSGLRQVVNATLTTTTDLASAGTACTTTAAVRSCTVSQQDQDVRYRVIATSTSGSSLSSEVDVVIGPGGPPSDVVATVTGRTIALTWAEPTQESSIPVADRTVVVTTRSGGAQLCEAPLSSGRCEFTVRAGAWDADVRVRSALGDSASVALPTIVVAAQRPTGVRSVTATRVSGGWRVTWRVPGDDGGSAILRHEVLDAKGKVVCRTTSTTCRISASITVRAGATLRVRAVTVAGAGPGVAVRLR